MKILISGYKGFIASNLHIAILKEFTETEVIGFDKLDKIPAGPFDFVIHLAALARTQECTEDPFGDSFDSNIILTNQLLKEIEFKHFIYAGSCACYGTQSDTVSENTSYSPPSIYAAQKAYSESLVRHFLGEKATILRLFNTYGPGQRQDGGYPNVIAAMIKSAKQKGVIEVTGNGLQTRDFVYVDDVIAAFIAAIKKPISTTVNICSGVETKILDLAIMLSQQLNKPIKFIEERKFDIYKQVGANTKASLFLGWSPKVSLEAGVRNTLMKEGLI